MAVSYIGGSTVPTGFTNTATVSPLSISVPANIAGDLLVCFVAAKPDTATITTPVGWADLVEVAGGGGTTGADTGPTRLKVFTREGAFAGPLSVTLGGLNVAWGWIACLRKTDLTWDVAGASGVDSTTGTPFQAAMTTDPGIQAGDLVLVAGSIPTDVSTPAQFSAETLTASGVTFGALTEIGEPDTSSGFDIGGVLCRYPVTAGASSGVATFSATATNASQVRGPIVLVRVRETSGVTVVTGAANLTAATSLSTQTTRLISAATTLTAQTTLTAAPTRATSTTANLTAQSTLTTSAARVVTASAALTASGALATTAGVTVPGAATLTGASGLTTAATIGAGATAALSATATFTASGTRTVTGPATLQAASSLAVAGVSEGPPRAELAASTTLTATTLRQVHAAANLAAETVLAAAITRGVHAAAVLSVSAELAATGSIPPQFTIGTASATEGSAPSAAAGTQARPHATTGTGATPGASAGISRTGSATGGGT